MRNLRFILEAIPAWIFYFLFRLIPVDLASFMCGKIMEFIGPRLRAAKTAEKNLKLCFPDKTEEELKDIKTGMWNNLGRIIGEAPSIVHMSTKEFNKRVKISKDFEKFKKPGIYISGHLGNFELAAKISIEQKHNINLVYRPANNKYINLLIKTLRARDGNRLIPKGRAGLIQILNALNDGQSIGMLVDQRMNDGIDSQFFGMNAKTTSLPAKLAIKYNVPIYISFMKREKACSFTVYFKKMNCKPTDDPNVITQQINNILESWIRENPQQWFWVHRRWG